MTCVRVTSDGAGAAGTSGPPPAAIVSRSAMAPVLTPGPRACQPVATTPGLKDRTGETTADVSSTYGGAHHGTARRPSRRHAAGPGPGTGPRPAADARTADQPEPARRPGAGHRRHAERPEDGRARGPHQALP